MDMERTLFGTDGVRGVVGEEPLTFNNIKRLAEAIGEFFGGRKIAIGRDTRASGGQIAEILEEALLEAGNEVEDYGVLPTPALSVLIKHEASIMGGIMVTASHNPANHNGIKVLGADGEKLGDEDELKIEKRALALEGDYSGEFLADAGRGVETRAGAVERYIQLAKAELGDFDLGGRRILVDAAAGAGRDFAKRVFEAFGAVAEQTDPEPTGLNINENCGVLFPKKLAKETAGAETAGVAFDGDADRVMLADETGRIWNGDRIVVLMAEELRKRGGLAGETVVLTEYSNFATLKYLEGKGIRVEKVVNGDRYVTERLAKLGADLGGELAGHVIYRPWLSSSDGMIMALFAFRLQQEKRCRLADLWANYEEMPTRQWGIEVREKRKLEKVAGWPEALAGAKRELGDSGRVFVRYSGTENKLRILVEAQEALVVDRIGEGLAKIIRKEIGRD